MKLFLNIFKTKYRFLKSSLETKKNKINVLKIILLYK